MTILGDFSLTGDLIGDKAILFGELGVLILTVGVFILTSISLFSDFVEDNVIITVCLLLATETNIVYRIVAHMLALSLLNSWVILDIWPA